MTEQDTITDIHGALRAAESAMRGLQSDIWWRGHGKDKWMESGVATDWKLVPGVYRKSGGNHYRYESNISGRFFIQARSRHGNLPEEGKWDEWLVLMQHYGLPTRLLDWTESILAATYFAVRGHSNKDAALWALSPTTFNENQVGIRGYPAPGNPLVAPLFTDVFAQDPTPQDKIVAFKPKELDTRMLVQQTCFTVHGSVSPIEDLEQHEQFLMKWTIPAGAKQKIKSDLAKLGIRESILFPDLDHLAKDLASQSFPQSKSEG